MDTDESTQRFLDLLGNVAEGRSARRAGELLEGKITAPITITWNIKIQPQPGGDLKITDTIKFSEAHETVFGYEGAQLELLLKAEA